MQKTQEYLQQNFDRFTQELLELLRIPSISADPANQKQVQHCAEAVAKHLEKIGMDDVEIIATKGHPIVGFGLDSDAIHSPNEHYGLYNYRMGIKTIPYFYKNFVELRKS
jgi:acetylornithine deacetylase/succinyl-diaminopimelate desuccinylase-like protein